MTTEPTKDKSTTKRKLIIGLAILLTLMIAFAIYLLTKPTPEVVAPEPDPAPIAEVKTQQEIWFENLEGLKETSAPDYICNVVSPRTIERSDGTVVETTVIDPTETPTYYYTPNAPEVMNSEPDEDGKFVSCSVVLLVPFDEQGSPDYNFFEPELNKFGYTNEGKDGFAQAPHYYVFPVEYTAADFLRSTVPINPSSVTENEDGTIIHEGEDSTTAFQTEFGDAPEASIQELRDRVSEDTYRMLNDYADSTFEAYRNTVRQ